MIPSTGRWRSADRLVADDELRRERERAGDGDALLLAARQFRGPPVEKRLRQAHQVEQLRRAPLALAPRAD